MILRRLVANLKQQQWTGVFIEVLIVVLGVFIGMQASNWNASVIEHHEAHDAMQRLEEDMRLSIKQTQSGIDFMSETARYSDLVFDRLHACNLPESDRDAFATGLYLLGKTVPAKLVRTTFDELRDSGRLGLIGSDELRRELNDVIRVQETHEVVFRLEVTRTDPQIAYIDSNVIYDIDGAIGGAAKITWNQVDIDFDAACKDRHFRAAVGAVRNYSYDNLYDVMRAQGRFKKLLAMIEKENSP
jgi:hypothetical protein